MPGLVPGIHDLWTGEQLVDGRDIGERSDAVLRTAVPGDDAESAVVELVSRGSIPLGERHADRPPTLNYSQFAISPFVNRRMTHHNRQALSSKFRFQ
jgi:hypothetical protein